MSVSWHYRASYVESECRAHFDQYTQTKKKKSFLAGRTFRCIWMVAVVVMVEKKVVMTTTTTMNED
jgi:hypothetical protein